MGKNKLQRYSDNKELDNVFEHTEFDDKTPPVGEWSKEVFGNDHSIIVELACGKGEYTTSLAQANPDKNFIGVDIKGDRIWKGANRAKDQKLENVIFLRCFIDHLDEFFGGYEIS